MLRSFVYLVKKCCDLINVVDMPEVLVSRALCLFIVLKIGKFAIIKSLEVWSFSMDVKEGVYKRKSLVRKSAVRDVSV